MKFVALPFKFLGLTATQLEERYKIFIIKTLNKVPEEKQTLPPPVIVSPILEHVKNIFDNETSELEDMFSDLLASAIDGESNYKVHPIFVNILKQLSPTDAKILNEFFPYNHKIDGLWIESDIAYVASEKEKEDGQYYYDKQLALHFVSGYENFTKYHTIDLMLSLDVLQSLNLIEITTYYDSTKARERKEFGEYYKKLLKSYWEDLISIDKIKLTTYGEQFLILCNKRHIK